MSLSTRRSCAARCTSSATSLGWPVSAMAGPTPAATMVGFFAAKGSASGGHIGRARLAHALDGPKPLGLPVACLWVYGPTVEFMAHQAPMALQRLKDQGGFNGDRIESCAMPTVFASGSDWLKTVVEKSDLAEGNFASTRIRETTFAHTLLRKARLRAARMERVEIYFCDLNEIDAGQLSARRIKIHGCEAMNAVFSGAQIAVARFEDTKLYRARFDGALLVRVLFVDSRLGSASMEKADFSGARLVDVSLRGANLMGASFARATLVGVDLREAALESADFSGCSAIGCHFPAGFGA
ncbi:MAG: pentapeptide repeat-containing protein [Deltaproteobacteria bacterium]|nr:MAG: pentapeptide repeat-containing protein [Deltaproteobacteria bacterium]